MEGNACYGGTSASFETTEAIIGGNGTYLAPGQCGGGKRGKKKKTRGKKKRKPTLRRGASTFKKQRKKKRKPTFRKGSSTFKKQKKRHSKREVVKSIMKGLGEKRKTRGNKRKMKGGTWRPRVSAKNAKDKETEAEEVGVDGFLIEKCKNEAASKIRKERYKYNCINKEIAEKRVRDSHHRTGTAEPEYPLAADEERDRARQVAVDKAWEKAQREMESSRLKAAKAKAKTEKVVSPTVFDPTPHPKRRFFNIPGHIYDEFKFRQNRARRVDPFGR